MSETAEQAVEDRPDNADELDALAAKAAEAEPANDADGGEAANEPDNTLSNADAIGMALGPAFAVLAPRWHVQPAEIEQLAAAYGDLADKYMPEGMAVGVELNAFLVTALILGPRLGQPRNDAAAEKLAEKRRKKQAAAEGEAARKAGEAVDAPAANDDEVGEHGA